MVTKDSEDKLSIQVMSGDELYEYRVNLTKFSIAVSVNYDEPLITINPNGLGLFYSDNL
jgi:HSP90 family molecular chaperone